MLRLERGELVVERVVRRVRHDGVVLDVVRDQRAVQQVAQLGCAGTRIRDAQAAPRRVSTIASGSSRSSRSRSWMRPQVTAIACMPAALAARMSNGESPTYAVSSGSRVHALGREQQRLGIGLVLLRLVAADDGLEEVRERHARERELDGRAALGGHDAEPAPLCVQAHEDVLHAGARLELVVERLVVGAVDADELVDPLGREDGHLRLEPGAADGLHQLGVAEVAAEHLARRVPHRREDDRAGVDDGAVEIEEDDRETDHGDPS